MLDSNVDSSIKSKLNVDPSVSKSIADDPASPPSHLQLHQYESPNNIFAEELLTDVNYGEWVVDITDSLIAKNKICFVYGTLPPTVTPGKKDALRRCNAMVKGRLKTSMSKEVRNSVRFSLSAREIWVDLQSCFGQGSTSRLYERKRTINILQQEKMSVSAFYTKSDYEQQIKELINCLLCCCCNR
ncbi:unnamed protein product [Linum trigynum]|uniref:Uncharacterized protein n=1 Tax=Linum trigynum TaxID=586398 RepID=A0AAV2DVK6_9ROSI